MEQLGSVVAEIDGQSPQALAEVAQQQAQQSAAEIGAKAWAQIPAMVGSLMGLFAEEVKPFFNEQACMEWGAAAQAVAEKRGWGGPDGIPELALAMSSLGMAVPTALIVNAKLKAIRAHKAAQEAAKGNTSAVVDTSAVPSDKGGGDGG